MGVLIAILTFLVAVVVFLGIWVFAGSEGSQEQVRKRMSAVHKAEKRGESSLGLKLARDELMSSVPWMNQLMMRWSWSTRLQDFLTQAGMTVRPAKLLLTSGVLGFSAYLISNYFSFRFYFAFPIGVAAALIPIGYVAFMRSPRLRQVAELFPEALDLLGRAARAR